ncbi:recombinase family protein [Collinsella sp. zg1085]|uniref:recombinase family protein n=1 Tax=Collinsella sp. zg1085 TaxID=2844380 RepID=UPI001C0D7AFB|nr:recombinase family protein [Collinsella sp. zg1085]QWT17700.1 recombinase family protein [Collinsella sp. zg1085]
MKKIITINANTTDNTEVLGLRVAAYCRVSTDSADQENSLEAQKKHYEMLISSHMGWSLVDVFFDFGISGTKKHSRPALNRMLKQCRQGLIDRVLTKSISRFSRNTTDCLEMVRELTALGVSIYFEKEQIDTLKMEDELFLTLLSSFAQDDSYSIAQNLRWSIAKRFQAGTFKLSSPPYGYIWNGENLVIDQHKAPIVQDIFTCALSGMGSSAIAKKLNDENVSPCRATLWRDTAIRSILTNEKYTGDVIFQKTYTDDAYKRHINRGEKQHFRIANHHEAIITHETFDKVQQLLSMRASRKNNPQGSTKCLVRYAFSGKISCAVCHSSFKRITYGKQNTAVKWGCTGHIRNKDACPIKAIPDELIKVAFVTMFNKLIYARQRILTPYLADLHSSAQDNSAQRIHVLTSSVTNLEQSLSDYQNLLNEGLIDQALYLNESSIVKNKIQTTKIEIEHIKRSIENSVDFVKATQELLDKTSRANMQQSFDEQLFLDIVRRVLIQSQRELVFELKCGLYLPERI